MKVPAGLLAALLVGAPALADARPAEPQALEAKDRARAAGERGDYPEAIRLLEQALASSPRDFDAALQLAGLYSWTGDFDRSIVAFRNILALDPPNRRAKTGLANVFRWTHRYAEAERLFGEVLEAEGEHHEALKGLAQTHAMAGNFPAALAVLDKAISLFPGDADLLREKGTLLGWQGRFREATSILQKAVGLNPRSSETFRTLGDVGIWKKDFPGAAESYRKALTLEPGSIETALDLANALRGAGRISEAEETLKEALRRAPGHHKAVELLQEIRRGDGRALWQGLLEALKPLTFVAVLVILLWLLHRKRRLARLRNRRYGALYRFAIPALLVVFVAAFLARRLFGILVLEDVAEVLLFATLGLTIALVAFEREPETGLSLDHVLVVGAHPDDIELGSAGFLLRLKDEGAKVYGLVMSHGEKGTPGPRADRRGEAETAARALGLDGFWVLDFPDTELRDHVGEMKRRIEGKIEELGIRLVLTHSPRETHGDHVSVFDAAKEASRHCSLLCFETVSTPQSFIPNFFVDISLYLSKKLRVLELHKTQGDKLYMDPEMVRGRAAHRGLQAGIPFAEAFWVYRWVR
jgi:LmbE family N-acetylglucosaminyl deacetylase/tetratricopeptide (TPR) repeat protein